MKKSLIAFLMMATFALTFTSCKKDEDDKKGPDVTENSWTIDGTKYELANAQLKPLFKDGGLIAAGKGSNLIITFPAKPAANGTYSVKAVTSELEAMDCTIIGTVGTKNYLSTGKAGNIVKVTVADGKVTVSISGVELSEVDLADPENGAKVSLSANLIEG